MANLRVLQINLNRSRAAFDLAYAMAVDRKLDVIVISEPPVRCGAGTFIVDPRNDAAVLLPQGSRIRPVTVSTVDGLVKVTAPEVTIVSGYFSPNRSRLEFDSFMEHLDRMTPRSNDRLVIAGDLNAKSPLWGSPSSDYRGKAIEEMIAAKELQVANSGTQWTFTRGGVGSIIDVTISSNNCRVEEWQILPEDSLSDHGLISFKIPLNAMNGVRPTHRPTTRRWCEKKTDVEALEEALRNVTIDGAEDAGSMVRQLQAALKHACERSMPRLINRPNKPKAYWWNAEISRLWKITNASKRKVQRARRRGGEILNNAVESLRSDRGSLRKSIRRSKETSWKGMCCELDSDPWGLPFRIVRGKLPDKAPPPGTMVVGGVPAIVEALFPRHEPIPVRDHLIDREAVPPVDNPEVERATARTAINKAPGPDGIPGTALKACGTVNPDILGATFTECLKEGTFPDEWKEAALILLHKPNKPPERPSSYRPICLLNTAGKVYERVLANRILESTSLAENQYGFVKARSTVDAVHSVMLEAKAANQGLYRNRQHCVIITFDIRNAFNSLPWRTIFDVLDRRGLPTYIIASIHSYLHNRWIRHAGELQQTTYPVRAGVPQGSVLGPLIWNLVYDELLSTELPSGTSLVGFADDLAVVSRHKDSQTLALNLQDTVDVVAEWLRMAGLGLAEDKTQMTALSSKRGLPNLTVRVGEATIRISKSIKYLGVEVSGNRWFTPHINSAVESGKRAVGQLCRLMANSWGPSFETRGRLFNSVVGARLLYAAPIWVDGLKANRNKEALLRVQRLGSLRACRAFRTVSTEAIMVICGSIPVDLLAEERAKLYHNFEPTERKNQKANARNATMDLWQARWDAAAVGRWTHTLIPDVATWIGRKAGAPSYHLTQILTGHGSFGSFLHRIGRKDSAECAYCQYHTDDAQHTLTTCPKWYDLRNRLAQALGVVQITPATLIEALIAHPDAWDELDYFARTVMGQKETDERVHQ